MKWMVGVQLVAMPHYRLEVETPDGRHRFCEATQEPELSLRLSQWVVWNLCSFGVVCWAPTAGWPHMGRLSLPALAGRWPGDTHGSHS